MPEEQDRKKLLGVVRAIAMGAMELPPAAREGFIERTVATIRSNYERTYGADVTTAAQADAILTLAREMVQILEESGGSIGHA